MTKKEFMEMVQDAIRFDMQEEGYTLTDTYSKIIFDTDSNNFDKWIRTLEDDYMLCDILNDYLMGNEDILK
jgi:hypothetical protein